MKRATAMARVFLLVLALLGMVAVGTGWAQPKTELTIALSSFSTEVLDPPLGGHLVKYYLSMIFDYLVGTTPDGQPSREGGIATRWENSPGLQALDLPPAEGREVPQRRRADLRGREVQHHAQHRQALHHRLRGTAAHPDPGHRDARARPGGDRDQGAHPDHPALPVPLALHRGHDPAEEVHRVGGRRRLRAQADRERTLQVRGAGDRLAHHADRRWTITGASGRPSTRP